MEVKQQILEKDQGFEEKREFLRIAINAPVSFHTGSGTWEKAQGRNLSGQGMMIETARKFSAGDRIFIQMKPHNQEQSLLEAEGLVMRVQTNSQGLYELGIRFETLK